MDNVLPTFYLEPNEWGTGVGLWCYRLASPVCATIADNRDPACRPISYFAVPDQRTARLSALLRPAAQAAVVAYVIFGMPNLLVRQFAWATRYRINVNTVEAAHGTYDIDAMP